MIDNFEVGLEFIDLNVFWGDNGFLVKDFFVVGYSVVSEGFSVCILGGIVIL